MKLQKLLCVRPDDIKRFILYRTMMTSSWQGYAHKKINNNNKLHFIHIGKCGGTSLVNFFKQKGIEYKQSHLKRPDLFEPNQRYIIWIRDPLNRFISAFNHSKEIVNFDISQLKGKMPSIHNCQAPQRIELKIKRGYAYEKDYEYLINRFESANHLAESLTGFDSGAKKDAKKLMLHRTEHIYKSIGWYLDNGEFVKHFYQQIEFVGSLENMNEDLNALLNILDANFNREYQIPHLRKNQIDIPKSLSSKARNNLYEFYKETDYKAIESLVDHDLLDLKVLEDYKRFAENNYKE